MRFLPPACLAVILLSACTIVPPKKSGDTLPPPVVEDGNIVVVTGTPRDVSEDGMNAPTTASASVLVVNKGMEGGSGMVMWSSSAWSAGVGLTMSSLSSSSSALPDTMGSGAVLVASGAVMTGSGAVFSASGAVMAGSGAMVIAPTSSSSVSSAPALSSSVAPASSSISPPASSVSREMVIQEGGPVEIPANNAVPGGGVQPRRVANNLVIAIETDYEMVPPGGILQLSIPVRNFSVLAAEGFLVEAQVPEGVTITAAVLGEIDGRSVRWRFNQLLKNQMYTLHFAVRAPRNIASQTLLPFSARVSGGNLGGSALVTTNVTIQSDLPQTGLDLSATLLQDHSAVSGGQRLVLIVAALTALALMAGLLTARVITSQRA